MLRIYEARQNHFHAVEDIAALILGEDMVWLDLINPSREEETALEAKLGLELPTRDEMRDIEPSSRLYEENGALYMTANILWKADIGQPENANIAFILSARHLITIRYADPRPFQRFTQYAERQGNVCDDAPSTLTSLLEAIVDRLAEILEITGSGVDSINSMIFTAHPDPTHRRNAMELEVTLRRIAFHQNMIAKVRDSLVSLGRMIGFAAHAHDLKATHGAHLATISRDIQSLTDHASFLSDNLTFMLDASLGLINIEQNAIIKIFSVAAVVFLPPTLVASIYGMNFKHMPELDWMLGYPMAVIFMVMSAILPYLWFKRKGWL